MHSFRPRLSVAVSSFCLLAIAAPAMGQMQTKSQIKCITATNDSVSKVAKTVTGMQAKCQKAAAASLQVMSTCLAADAGGKVAAAITKAASKDAKFCPSGLTDFAYTSSATATAAGVNAATNAFNDIMNPGAMGAIIQSSADSDGAKCQAAISKGAAKLLLAMLAEFRACKKAGLSDGSITNTVALGNACFDAVTADASGKIGAAQSKVADAFSAKCVDATQAAVIPGDCAGAADPVACIAGVSRCRTCQAFNEADNLVRGCDQFDDGAINGSCESTTLCDDDDEDGYGTNCTAGEDCNDVNASVNPGADEICNGLDDDCNDFVDDSPVDDGASCGSNGNLPCMLGTIECVNSELVCVGNVEPTAEICNGEDDDCNGDTDDNATCDIGMTCQSGSCQP
jgi:hypothetical protein